MNSTTKTILIAAAIYFLYKKGVFKKKSPLIIPEKSPLTGSSFLNKKKPMTLNFAL